MNLLNTLSMAGILPLTELPVPEPSGNLWVPDQPDSFWEGVREIVLKALPELQPALAEGLGACLVILAVVLLVAVVRTFPGSTEQAVELAGAVTTGTLLLRSTHSLVGLGVDTVRQLSEYGKLLLPVMAAALAGSGGTVTSVALYGGTVIFDTVLSSLITRFLVPMIYVYLCLCVANQALGEDTLKKLADLLKWLMTWGLKIILYLFTGYIGLTGVVSGTTDAAAMKAAKLTVSGMIPVVGGILSDASEAVLIGADAAKNAVGIYGMLAVLAIWIRPFLEIGVQYLLLKATAAVCGIFGTKRSVGLVKDYSGAMGLLLAMTGACRFLLLVSLICFLKGVG